MSTAPAQFVDRRAPSLGEHNLLHPGYQDILRSKGYNFTTVAKVSSFLLGECYVFVGTKARVSVVMYQLSGPGSDGFTRVRNMTTGVSSNLPPSVRKDTVELLIDFFSNDVVQINFD